MNGARRILVSGAKAEHSCDGFGCAAWFGHATHGDDDSDSASSFQTTPWRKMSHLPAREPGPSERAAINKATS